MFYPSLLIPGKRSILGNKRSFWGVIESFEKDSTEYFESVANVKGLPGIK